jgi:hypothetical protein
MWSRPLQLSGMKVPQKLRDLATSAQEAHCSSTRLPKSTQRLSCSGGSPDSGQAWPPDVSSKPKWCFDRFLLAIKGTPFILICQRRNSGGREKKCRPNAPFAELVRLSRTSIADEMREEHRRRVLGDYRASHENSQAHHFSHR